MVDSEEVDRVTCRCADATRPRITNSASVSIVSSLAIECAPVPAFERSRGAVDTIKGQVAELFNLHVMNLSM